MIAQSWHREPQSLSQIRIHSSALDLPAPELGQSTAPNIAFTFDDPTTEGGANLGWKERSMYE
jgi:hypothetical protein